jgi:Tol biopolymer transport system component
VLFLDSVPGKADLVDYEPAWSPSGTHLAFISNRNGPLKVYTAKADGTELTQLTQGPDEDDSPSWSPDGKQIAFVSNRDGNPEIYRMNADGSDQTRLTDDPGIDIHPVWAPDGKVDRLELISKQRRLDRDLRSLCDGPARQTSAAAHPKWHRDLRLLVSRRAAGSSFAAR